MKKRHLLMTTLLLLSSSYLSAQTKNDSIRYEIVIPEGVEYNITSYDTQTIYTPVCRYNKEGDMINVTVRGVSKMGVKPSAVGVFNNEFKKKFDFSKGTEKTIEIPKGRYDMFMQFRKGTSYYVFKENIEVNDGDIIEFDKDEATNKVTYSFVDESNEELFMDVYDGSKLVESGNADNITKITSFNNKEYGTLATILSKGYMQQKYPMEFYVNNLSDRYVIGNGTNIIANGTTYTYKDAITNVESDTYRQLGGDNFVTCTTTIDVPNLLDGADDVFVQGYTFTVLYKGLAIIGEKSFISKNECPDKTFTNIMNCPESDEYSDDMVNVIYQPAISNYYEKTDNKRKFFGVRGCGMIGDKNGVKYINAGQDSDWGGWNIPQGANASQFYPGHPEFSYERKDGVMTLGNSCPAVGIRSRRYKVDGVVKGWNTPFFTGRYGERFESDAYILEIDEQKLDDGRTYGKIVNNLALVDGKAAENVTEYWVDLTADDFIAPTLQMVSFKDADGVLTDRLANNKGSRLIFTGGDFDYIYNNDVAKSYYTCGDAEVTVSYSIHGANEWNILVVNEIPEKKFMPYFGNFYESSLDDVACDTDNQWFDLMFTFKDATGNYQKQTISPAFLVMKSSDTGINDVSESALYITMMGDKIRLSNGEKAHFEVLTLGGNTYRTTYSNEISISELPHGVYIVVAKTENKGILTKKIVKR